MKVYQKKEKKQGLSFEKIGDDVIAQKPMTSLKQIDLFERFSQKHHVRLL
jgi:hypothetical protein